MLWTNACWTSGLWEAISGNGVARSGGNGYWGLVYEVMVLRDGKRRNCCCI